MKGEAAFYGPKIDMKLIDAIGRPWQLSTVQFDFNLPKKFNLEFVGSDGARHRPLMVHRALYGSVERFFGILVEHYAGNFPLWLAPVQVKILTLTDAQIPPAEELKKKLEAAGLRVELDGRPEKIGHKIRETTLAKVPYMVLLGPKDVEAGTLAVRLRDGRQMNGVTSAAFVRRLTEEVAQKKTAPSEELCMKTISACLVAFALSVHRPRRPPYSAVRTSPTSTRRPRRRPSPPRRSCSRRPGATSVGRGPGLRELHGPVSAQSRA